MHLPAWVDAEYVEQLTAEKKIHKYVKGKGSVPEWVKTRERNEALDLTVYSLAALYILGPALLKSLEQLAAQCARPAEEVRASASAPKAQPRKRWTGTSRWINSWRDGL